MTWRTGANPFNDLSLTELATASRGTIESLRDRSRYTPEERKALAHQVTLLLMVLADRIEPKLQTPDQPEDRLRRGPEYGLVETFTKWHHEELDRAANAVRRRTLARAADWVLGRDATRWIDPQCGSFGERPRYRIHSGDATLYELLRDLEAMQRITAMPPG